MGSPVPIWRRLLIQPHLTLDIVHEMFQIAMGWWNYHLYDFQKDDRHFGDLVDSDGDETVEDASEIALKDILKRRGDHAVYAYDFGDGWMHDFVLEDIIPFKPYEDIVWAKCLHGRRAGPPEDCGGISGFAELIEAVEDPLHPLREEKLEWLESDYNPDAFDTRLINLRLVLLEQEKQEEEEALRFFAEVKLAQEAASKKKPKKTGNLKLISADQEKN